MEKNTMRRLALISGGFLGVWLFAKYLLPLLFPFGIGLLLALAAEPAVRAGTRLLKLPRWAASGAGVFLTLLLLVTLVGVLGAAIVKEISVLAGQLPDLQATAQQTADTLRGVVDNAVRRMPEGVRPLVDRSVTRLFSSSDILFEQASVRLPGAITSFLGKLPDGALTVGTGILSGFMLSARLPRLKAALQQRFPKKVRTDLLPPLKKAKNALLAWLKAQLKLSAITFCVLLIGFLLLRIPFAPLWAALAALVDAVPVLGTGTVLLPWALVCLLQGQHFRAIGLLWICGAAFLTRTTLEPRLVGRHLGVDPLITLVFLYLGYRFFGFLGMIMAPMLLAAITAVSQSTKHPGS